jgi:hypothetical protein
MRIQRLVYYAKPTKAHQSLCEWETATSVLFVAVDARHDGIQRAREHLRFQCWQPIRLLLHDVLSERLVIDQGGDVLDAYRIAEEKGISCTFFPDTFGTGKTKNPNRVLSPDVGEKFIDRIISQAGGRRLTTEECGIDSRNADYRLDNWILELKDLQEEGLEKEPRQLKLAELFSAENWGDHVEIRLDTLNEEERMAYLEIIEGPVKSHVRSASKQIMQSMKQIGASGLRGGLIFLNTGYGSLPPTLFEDLVERHAAKRPHVECCICISAWVLTNGFDSQIQFKFHPLDSSEPTVQKLSDAFSAATDEMMTEWARSGFKSKRPLMPLNPIAFEIAGRTFFWEPEHVSQTW